MFQPLLRKSLLLLFCLSPMSLFAAEAQSIIIDNYNRMPVGSMGSMQGGAITARANTADAAWYNLAGITQKETSSIDGNVSVYGTNNVTLNGGDVSTNIDTISSFLGGTGKISDDFYYGYSIVVPASFSSSSRLETYTEAVDSDANATVTTEVTESSASFRILAPGFGVAYRIADWLSIGVGARLYIVDIAEQDSWVSLQDGAGYDAYDNLYDSTYNESGSSSLTGSANLLRFEVGIQASLGNSIKLGFNTRTASSRVLSSGRNAYTNSTYSAYYSTGTTDDGDTYVDSEIFSAVDRNPDESTVFDYQMPQETTVGLAFMGDTLEIELDATVYSKIASYDMFSAYTGEVSEDTTTISGDDGTGFTHTNTKNLFEDEYDATENSAEQVVNYAIAGKIKFDQALHLYFGFWKDNSPLSELGDSVSFDGAALGFSKQTDGSVLTAGVFATQGTSADPDLDLSILSVGAVIGASKSF
ncbi:MAG: hypothetical protein QNL04_00225 [SAR324 cluster bacterium]|nr:hypothetical protein [SAR324 cluster bacterium]